MDLEEDLGIKRGEVEEKVESTETSKEVEQNGGDVSGFKMPEQSPDMEGFTHEDPAHTEIGRLWDRATTYRNDQLEYDKKYEGCITNVEFREDDYPRIIINIKIDDSGDVKRIFQEYSFGGKWDDFSMKRLVDLLSGVRGFKLSTVNSRTLETITESMQFLIEAKVSIIQKLSKNEKLYYDINVLGEYDAEKKRVV